MTELIVVLSIIAVLLALLLPATQVARERAREAVCKNNLHQLNLALSGFVEIHKKLPAKPKPGFANGWSVEVLPFIEQRNLQVSIPTSLPLSSVTEDLYVPPAIFRCPKRSNSDDDGKPSPRPSHYVLLPGLKRDYFSLADAPTDLEVPWLSSPELPNGALNNDKGPHHGGYFFASGFQQHIVFLLDGKVVD